MNLLKVLKCDYRAKIVWRFMAEFRPHCQRILKVAMFFWTMPLTNTCTGAPARLSKGAIHFVPQITRIYMAKAGRN
jgi:hypothetical protein